MNNQGRKSNSPSMPISYKCKIEISSYPKRLNTSISKIDKTQNQVSPTSKMKVSFSCLHSMFLVSTNGVSKFNSHIILKEILDSVASRWEIGNNNHLSLPYKNRFGSILVILLMGQEFPFPEFLNHDLWTRKGKMHFFIWYYYNWFWFDYIYSWIPF